jgi:hypothetical protein
MLTSRENWRDVQKYYQHTFIKLTPLGETVVYVDNISNNLFQGTTHEGVKVEFDLDEGYYIDYCIPRKTVFQLNNYAAVLRRIPARMWKKGLSKENTQIYGVQEDGSLFPLPLNSANVWAYVNKPQYYQIGDPALKSMNSAALNNRLYMTSEGYIYADDQAIGKLEGNTVFCWRLFETELQDVVDKNKYTITRVN